MKSKLEKLVYKFERRLISSWSTGVKPRINYSIFDLAAEQVKEEIQYCGHRLDFHVLMMDAIAEISPTVGNFVGDMDEHAFEVYCLSRGYSFPKEKPGFTAREMRRLAGILGISPLEREEMEELVRYIASQQMDAEN